MPTIPLPALTLLALAILTLTLWTHDRVRYRRARFFLLVSLLLMALNTAGWIWPSVPLTLLRVALALLLPMLAWHGFWPSSAHRFSRLSLAPVALAVALACVIPVAIDLLLFALYTGYGVALIAAGLRVSEGAGLRRIRALPGTAKVALAVGGFLLLSALSDLTVALAFHWHQGARVVPMIAALQTLLLPFLTLAIMRVARRQPVSADESGSLASVPAATASSPAQVALCQQLDSQMLAQTLFLDSALTLARLARKTGITTRHLSAAVNAVHHCNVSQWINGYRVRHACALLHTDSASVTEVMLASGFITKSNFNREFLRITGQTPSAFRQQRAPAPPSERAGCAPARPDE
ncbi:helix-turn-helix domain-containing protein [Pantoea sp. Mb-10]|uniref:helix-turn-helix domain-containing protein n=1 Tax=unclassified Pantoea TaxID=2630326 RepID=UPI001E495F0B|nr:MULTISPECIES: AraC family transcriptional regulator [unclassified Pantoea]MCE0490724.1 helix-turn-helix domain-containing protein [Pantoea sp. Mb-10]MCE0500118.1 helix-turn-helix domain-containing protein [Pantoea sp. Pb-8]